jgi:hypothetical protein
MAPHHFIIALIAKSAEKSVYQQSSKRWRAAGLRARRSLAERRSEDVDRTR